MITVDKIINSFPKPTPKKIVGIPSYESIKYLNGDISTNTASVHSDLGDGNHGHLRLLVNPVIYATIFPVPYQPPANPAPPNTAGMTGPQITAANLTLRCRKRKFAEYIALQNALKN